MTSRQPNPQSQATPLSEELRLRVTNLSYLAFALCVSRILTNLGYANIPLPSRRTFKGYNATAGIDLHAWHQEEFGMLPVYVQLKQWRTKRPIAQRVINEFRGTLLKGGVSQGLIFATVRFSEEAKAAALRYPGRPIRLINGEEIGVLMEFFRIGVREGVDIVTGKHVQELDEQAFQSLEAYAEQIRKTPRLKGGGRA